MQDLLAGVQQVQTVSIVIGLVILLAWESFQPFFGFFRGQARNRGIHLLHNLLLGVLNAVVVAVFFVGLWLLAASWAEQQQFGLLHWLGDRAGLPLWAHALGAVLLLDAWTYLWHRLNHRVHFLWRFHRVHHADNKMDVTTASRFHVGEIFFSSILRVPLIIFFGVYLWELLLYETIMFAVVQFHHANIALPTRVDRTLRAIIVTPAMHKVHHSRWQPETDSNYSALFSVWDRLGKSFRYKPNLSDIQFGLDSFDDPGYQTLGGMLKTPLAPGDSEGRTSGGNPSQPLRIDAMG